MRSLTRTWTFPRGRDAVAVGLSLGVVAAAAVALVAPQVPSDSILEIPWWRSTTATAAMLIVVAMAIRRHVGLFYLGLAFASTTVAQPLESAWYAARSLAYWGDAPAAAVAEAGAHLALLSGLVQTTIPAAIVALYATATERRLATWLVPVVWLLVLATAVSTLLRLQFEISAWPEQDGWSPGVLDGPPVLVIAALGMLGSLRSAAHRYVWAPSRASKSTGPTRPILAAIAVVAFLWLPALYAYLNRPAALETADLESARLVWLPILFALVGFVATRWSRFVAWAAVAVAFQADAVLVLYRGLAEYVAEVLAHGPDVLTPPPVGYLIWTAAGVLIQLFAFAAMSLAALAVLDAKRDEDRPEASERSWALRGALAGLAVCLWYLGIASAKTGVPFAIEVLYLPAYPLLAFVLAPGAWRRLVPAVAEAESVALRPFRPHRYLETVVSESITGHAEHGRRAADEERARLASDLHAEFLPYLEQVAARNAAGASREELGERLRELQDEVRQLMSERRHVVLEEFGIVEALEWLVGRAEERVAFPIEMAVDDASTRARPPREVERAAFRIAQLAVENAIQHASPTRLTLNVLARKDRLTIAVSDDGRGLSHQPTDPRRDHVGLADMRAQANDVRGALEVSGSSAGGTTVNFAWPATG